MKKLGLVASNINHISSQHIILCLSMIIGITNAALLDKIEMNMKVKSFDYLNVNYETPVLTYDTKVS